MWWSSCAGVVVVVVVVVVELLVVVVVCFVVRRCGGFLWGTNVCNANVRILSSDVLLLLLLGSSFRVVFALFWLSLCLSAALAVVDAVDRLLFMLLDDVVDVVVQ